MKIILSLAIIALSIPALSQTVATPAPIAQVANAVPVCNEGCVITSISDLTAVLQFGSGAKWCQTVTASALKLPATVSYTNTAICPYDPFPYMTKTLAAVQKSTAYTITYTLAGVKQPVMTIPALPPPPPPPGPTVLNTWLCKINQMSDGTFYSIPGSCTLVTQ